MSHDTEAAQSDLRHSGHELAQPLQTMLLKQEEMRQSLDEQRATINKLERAVLGDADYFQEGILPTLNNHEKRIRSLENWRVYVVGGVAALAIIWNIIKPFLPKLQ